MLSALYVEGWVSWHFSKSVHCLEGMGENTLKVTKKGTISVFSGDFRLFSGCFQGVFPHPLCAYSLWTLPSCLWRKPRPKNRQKMSPLLRFITQACDFWKRAEYCFEPSPVSSAKSRWARRTNNNRLKGTHWVLSPELGEGKELTELGVWNRALKNRIRPASENCLRPVLLCPHLGLPALKGKMFRDEHSMDRYRCRPELSERLGSNWSMWEWR